MESFSGVKRAQNSKTEGEIERKKKTWKCKSEGKRCAWGDFLPREKPEECTVKQLQRWLLCRGAKTSGKKTQLVQSTRGPRCSWSYLCTKTQQLACLVIIQGARGCSTCPPNNPITECAFSLGPRLSLSSEVSYMESYKVVLTNEWVEEISWCDHSNKTSLPVLSHGTTVDSR